MDNRDWEADYTIWMTRNYAKESEKGPWHKHEKGILIAAFRAGWEAAKFDHTSTSPRPWSLQFQSDGNEFEFGGRITYLQGIVDANGEWVVRFDDDYGTDQVANAKLIMEAVNGYDKGSFSRPVSS